jgi:hypothetical protein
MPSKLLICGAPGMTRTCDLLVRSQTLYPTELRARAVRLLELSTATRFPPIWPSKSGCDGARSLTREDSRL